MRSRSRLRAPSRCSARDTAGSPRAPPVAVSPVVASLERTGCNGTCPVYRVSVHADGTVDYLGRAHVKIVGARSGHITADQVTRLLGVFDEARCFSLAPGGFTLDL